LRSACDIIELDTSIPHGSRQHDPNEDIPFGNNQRISTCCAIQMNKRTSEVQSITLRLRPAPSDLSRILPGLDWYCQAPIMTSPYPQVEEKTVNADAAKYTRESADSSGDMFHDPPEYKLQRQLKNRHIAMIRFAERCLLPCEFLLT
jgi:hypothetical protein